MSALGDVTGRRVVVTGGGGGLGSAIAAELCRLGARVLVCGRARASLDAVVGAVGAELGAGRCAAAVCDVREPGEVEAMLDAAGSAFGGVDGLVNNASGLFPVRAERLTPNGFRAVVDVVLRGTWHCTAAAARRWIDRGETGAVVNVLTPYAWTGAPGIVHTASAKGGVLTMTRTLGAEWGPHGIRVNAVAPGWMQVGGTRDLVTDPERERRLLEAIPMRRWLRAEETARAIAYLLSDDAAYITGTCLCIDGGHHLSRGLQEICGA
jgi:NAD(P)-dependent dehydrogenase (short-subunit alcohol dehydrogenase family)